ncbi:hypothetical protein, partial [Streptococcus danieliae]|uniref:hypothetical protein n=1 Tax=Streptococcus danieliae TaxID=747656 RepID=UPI0026F28983
MLSNLDFRNLFIGRLFLNLGDSLVYIIFMGTSKNQLSSIISKKEETLALQFPARVPVFPTF